MEQKPDDLTAPQGGKSNKRVKKTYIDPNTIPMKEGDILKLNPEYTIAETEWKDVEGNVYDQSMLSAAQLIIARKYKLVVPKELAIMMANGTDDQCKEAIARLKRQYADKLLDPFELDPIDIDAAARQYANIAMNMPIERVKESAPNAYTIYIAFKRGVLWLAQFHLNNK